MWPLMISLGVLGVEYVYHNWIDPPKPPPPEQTIQIPLTTTTTAIPLLYGRCRVTAPVLAYTSEPIVKEQGAANIYAIDMLFVLGIPFRGGVSRIRAAYIGDNLMTVVGGGFLGDQTGQGNFEDLTISPAHLALETPTVAVGDDEVTQGNVEFLNGNENQTLVDPTTGTPTTEAGKYMTSTALFDLTSDEPWNHGVGFTNPFQIPGYRGYLTAFLWAQNQTVHWAIGVTPNVGAYSYEVSTYPALSLANPFSDDVNPIDVLYDLLTDKLGVSVGNIDLANFTAAAETCRVESNLMSIAFQEQQTVAEIFDVILRQIDGGLRWNPQLDKLQVKLIRPDYDPPTLPVITPDNCEGLQNFSAGGWADLPNRVVVTFTDRANSYKQGTAIAYRQAVGDNGETRQLTADMPGVTFQELADAIAARVLASVSRPLMQCRAIVNRSFLRVLPGDVVKLTWPEGNISGIIFRVTGVGYGTLDKNAMYLDLTQDYFYTHRNHPPGGGGSGGLGGDNIGF